MGIALLVRTCISVAGVARTEAKEQWRLGTQAYSFNRFTFYEAVAKTKSVGLKYIEAYPGQKISKEHGDATLDHNMSPELRLQVLEMLKEQGLKLVNYGVVGLPNNGRVPQGVNFARLWASRRSCPSRRRTPSLLIDRLCQYKIGVASTITNPLLGTTP